MQSRHTPTPTTRSTDRREAGARIPWTAWFEMHGQPEDAADDEQNAKEQCVGGATQHNYEENVSPQFRT
jgi:hypothetical protein